jgi:TolB-like protein
VKILLGGSEVARVSRPVGSENTVPETRATKNRVPAAAWVGALAVVVIGFAATFFATRKGEPNAGAGTRPPTAEVAAPKTAEKSIAVLAFANRSDDRATEYFSDGISEDLLNVLSQVPELRVAGWASALTFKGQNPSPREIGEKLGVAHYVDGSVRKDGTRVKITARLTRTNNGEQVWGESYDEEAKDIFALQDKLARDIAQKLQLKLGGTTRPAAVNPEAHRLVLEGRHFWNQRSNDGFARAEQLFKEAIQVEPRFAESHAGLAMVHVVRANYRNWDGYLDNEADLALSRDHAQSAIELDAASADAYATLGYGLMMKGRLAEAEQPFKAALQRNLNSSAIRSWHGILHSTRGEIHMAIADCAKALELDPLWMANISIYGGELVRARKFTEAIAVGERGRALNPDFVPNRATLAIAYFRTDDRARAVESARFILDHAKLQPRWRSDMIALWILAQTGSRAEASERGRACLEAFPPGSFMRGFVHAALGRFDEALPLLASAPIMQGRSLYYDEVWDAWRDDPRFHQLIAKLGIAEQYKTARETLARMQRERAGKK